MPEVDWAALRAAARAAAAMAYAPYSGLLYEFGGSELLVDGPHGPLRLGDLLPHAFGPDDLP